MGKDGLTVKELIGLLEAVSRDGHGEAEIRVLQLNSYTMEINAVAVLENGDVEIREIE